MTEKRITELARALGKACQRRRVWVATAESCTGGGVAEAITRIAGSSGWFECGFVTYSNAAKHDLLHVPREALERLIGQGADWMCLDAYLVKYVVEPSLAPTVFASSFASARPTRSRNDAKNRTVIVIARDYRLQDRLQVASLAALWIPAYAGITE